MSKRSGIKPRLRRIGKIHAVVLGMSIGGVIFVLGGVVWLSFYLIGNGFPISPENTPAPLLTLIPASATPPSVILTPTPDSNPTILPEPTITPEVVLTPTVTLTPTLTYYVVQEGDTLYNIAFIFNTTVETLLTVNNLSSPTIYPGQELLITWDQQVISTTALPPTEFNPDGYTVAATDTLASIAAAYNLDTSVLRAANYMVGDAILPGQRLNIPQPGQDYTLPPYQFSILEGNLDTAYPFSWDGGNFTLHYSANTFVAVDPQAVGQLVQNALTNDVNVFQAFLPYHFDVYTAGSVFVPPYRALRGRSFSASLRYHFLHDGTGSATDQQYIAAHELTHLYTWNVYGAPVSIMLSEGAATYAGMHMIADSAHLPLDTFCAAYLQADTLPYISSSLSYTGHNIDLENYYAAGCFVGYLIQLYGPTPFGQLYATGNYEGIYGQSLFSLEADWRAYTATLAIPSWLDAGYLVAQVDAVTNAYANFFPYFNGSPAQIEAYYHLDQARLALLEARLSDSSTSLQSFTNIINQP